MFHPVATNPFVGRLFDHVLPRGLDDDMLNTCLCFETNSTTSDDNATSDDTTTLFTHDAMSASKNHLLLSKTSITSFPEPGRCIPISSQDMDHLLPAWNLPGHHGASADIETSSRHIKDWMLACLFLIGGPANVINMAIFYKQGLRDRINLCLFAQSLADGLYLLSAVCLNGEQLVLQVAATTGGKEERYGPVLTFLANSNLIGFTGFCFVSFVLSAILASEKCRCVLNPLKFKAKLGVTTMVCIVCAVYISVLGLYFLVAFRYRVGCLRHPHESGRVMKTGVNGAFYQAHRELVDYLDGFVFGGAIPVAAIAVVVIATGVTTVKLRQALVWRRKGTHSTAAAGAAGFSAREVALTKMLIGNSVLFIVCVSPPSLSRFVCLFMPEMNMAGGSQDFFLTSLWASEVLSYVNASFNFFVYWTMGSRYRDTLRALLRVRGESRGKGTDHYYHSSKVSTTMGIGH